MPRLRLCCGWLRQAERGCQIRFVGRICANSRLVVEEPATATFDSLVVNPSFKELQSPFGFLNDQSGVDEQILLTGIGPLRQMRFAHSHDVAAAVDL